MVCEVSWVSLKYVSLTQRSHPRLQVLLRVVKVVKPRHGGRGVPLLLCEAREHRPPELKARLKATRYLTT